jgi:hypothetical protein
MPDSLESSSVLNRRAGPSARLFFCRATQPLLADGPRGSPASQPVCRLAEKLTCKGRGGLVWCELVPGTWRAWHQLKASPAGHTRRPVKRIRHLTQSELGNNL